MREMKKAVSAAIIISALLISLVAGVQIVEVAKANFMPFYNVVINVQSPQNGTSYNIRTLPLNFTVESNQEDQTSTRYILNSEKPVDVATTVVSSRIATMQVWNGWSSEPNQTKRYVLYTAEGNTGLDNLADGTYNLTIQRYFTYSITPQEITIYNATTVTFTIDTTSPSIQIIQPENKTYNTTNIPLNFTLTEPSTIRYSIDKQDNITLAGNTTLTGLPDGLHNITIYANDTAGNMGKSDVVFFTVATQPLPSPSPNSTPSNSITQQPTLMPSPTADGLQTEDYTPTLIIYTSIAVVAALVALVYFKKRRG